VLVWGENTSLLFPYGDRWSPDRSGHDLKTFREKKANMWMAVLSPELEDAFAARALYLDRLYAVTAQREGYSRWGLKEVNWNETVLHFINKKFPESNVVFLIRDFFMSFTSRFKKDFSVHTPNCTREGDIRQFCEEWIKQFELIAGIEKNHLRILVRHEDLVSGGRPAATKLCQDVGLINPPDPDQYETKISCTGMSKSARAIYSEYMKLVEPYLQDINRLQEAFGYDPIQP
jgi:hypothetical protein